MYICNICERAFEGDRKTCRECFNEIATTVRSNLFSVEEPPATDLPARRPMKLKTSHESCESKVAFKTPEEAVRARKKFGKKKSDVKKQRIYKCDNCPAWHLTSVKDKNQ